MIFASHFEGQLVCYIYQGVWCQDTVNFVFQTALLLCFIKLISLTTKQKNSKQHFFYSGWYYRYFIVIKLNNKSPILLIYFQLILLTVLKKCILGNKKIVFIYSCGMKVGVFSIWKVLIICIINQNNINLLAELSSK